MIKHKKAIRTGALASAVTGAAIIAAAGMAHAEPIKPNCQWNKNGYTQYPLQYPQSCKDYDSKDIEPTHKGGNYTS